MDNTQVNLERFEVEQNRRVAAGDRSRIAGCHGYGSKTENTLVFMGSQDMLIVHSDFCYIRKQNEFSFH